MAAEAPREQEQSIKARKKELYGAEAKAVEAPRRQFSEYVGKTPPAPLASGVKTALWALAVVVALLFLLALYTIPAPRGRAFPRPRAEARQAGGR